MSRINRLSIIVAPSIVALLLYGCGGSSGEDGAMASRVIVPTESPAPTPTPSPTAPTSPVIKNSGSTNTTAWSAAVSPDGSVAYVNNGVSGSGTISATLATRFFQDLGAAAPLSSLPIKSCIKSVSFGTRTVITWEGQASPDISCPGNAASAALAQDASAIAAALHLGGPRRLL